MTHPLDEVRNTPWGRRVDDDLIKLKARVGILDSHMTLMRTAIHENNKKMDDVKADTQWIVDILRGSRALGRVLIAFAVIFGAIAAGGVWLGWAHHP